MSWYRTHRPRTINGLHLVKVRQALKQFMQKGQIPQVLLFAGPRGTGKTSSARIIGAILNDPANEAVVDYQFFHHSKPKAIKYQEPDIKSEFNDRIYRGQSFIVQEMDAASNRGIDDIRDLKERVAIPPQEGKMTVYILDEAHMLTTAAFNALLKLLEEPPPHTVFILATTELHKIPATIKSRCSTIHFYKASQDELKQAMIEVLQLEEIQYEEAALEAIAKQAEGSFRDAVKLLEMVAIDGQINAKSIATILASSVLNDIQQLLGCVLDKNEVGLVELFEALRARNVDEVFFFKSLLDFLHTNLLQSLEIKSGKPFLVKKVAQFLLKEFSQVELLESPIPHLSLEIKSLALIERASKNTSGRGGGGFKKSERTEPKKKDLKIKKNIVEKIATSAKILPKGDSRQLFSHWSELLAAVKQKNITLEALLRSAKLKSSENGTAQIEVFYKFHKEQLEQPKFKALIDECATTLAGGQVKLEYILSQLPAKAELVDADNKTQDLATLAEEVLV